MNDRIRTLDGIRGIAILLVVAGHLAANYQPLDNAAREWLVAFANPGAGVRLFFVLSGYLITHLLVGELKLNGTISVRQFYRRRALRIFPAFYVYLLALTVAAQWLPTGINGQSFTAAATFTWNYSPFWITPPPEGTWNLGHLWTLALEQQFYLFWPVGLLLLGLRRAFWLAVALVLWCPAARVGTYFAFPAQRGLVGIMLHTGIDSLMAGCLTAFLVDLPAVRDWLARRGAAAAVAAIAWLALASPLCALAVRGFGVAAGFTLDAVAAGTVIAWVHHCPPPAVRALLGRGLLPWLGLVSYSLYLWQQVYLAPGGPLQHGSIAWPLAAAIATAIASYLLVERPALRLKTRRPAPGTGIATLPVARNP